MWLPVLALILWDTRDTEAWEGKIKEPLTVFTALLAVATVALAFVAGLQWDTLEKTDHTLRAGQRAFVFLNGITMTEHPVQPTGYEWYFTASIENNGSTQTKGLFHRLSCVQRPSISEIWAPLPFLDQSKSMAQELALGRPIN